MCSDCSLKLTQLDYVTLDWTAAWFVIFHLDPVCDNSAVLCPTLCFSPEVLSHGFTQPLQVYFVMECLPLKWVTNAPHAHAQFMIILGLTCSDDTD